MVMPIQYDYYKIENVRIDKYYIKKGIIKDKIFIKGTCKVITDEYDENFIMDFNYEGNPYNNTSVLYEYLKHLGWKESQKRNKKTIKTIIELCKDIIKEE
jgi:hypothetical protein